MARESIVGLLDDAARSGPDVPLLLSTVGASVTVSEVADLTIAGMCWLAQLGISAGTTVAWQLPSHSSAAVLMLSLARAKAVQAPVLHLNRTREVRAALDVARADVLIVDDSTEANAPSDIEIICLPSDFLGVLSAQPRSRQPAPAREDPGDSARWIYFTSGTSGDPKAVQHNDSTLLASAHGFRSHLGLGDYPGEVGSIAFPIAHVGGIVYLAAALMGKFPVLMVPKVFAAELTALLAAHRVTVSGSSTALYQMLLAEQLASESESPIVPSLRMLVGGGAHCPPELHHKVRRHMAVPIVHAYGMTEAPMICVSAATDTEEQQSNSSGRPIPGAEIRIGASGEIEVRGSNLASGYLDTEQWAQALTADGWFRTGDRGHVRADGRIVVSGRVKDLIIRKGENIAPEEVENELLAHPLIDAVAVIGLADEQRGELVCAVVRRCRGRRDVTLEDICQFLDHRGLMKQKWPERLVIVDEFPMTGLGKVAKNELESQIVGGSR
ncbi:class I adenylate-forming enzyme family protein [Mycobacterium sp. MUNTM1]